MLTRINNENDRMFIHYGSDRYDINKFQTIQNSPMEKPVGGLWACDVKTRFGWKEWCLSEEMYPPESKRLKECFRFRLKKDALILQLKEPEDFEFLPIQWSKFKEERTYNPYLNPKTDRFRFVNWAEIKNIGIDAVEYIRTPYGHDVFYTWDFDSLVVMNPDAVVPVE